jgi:lysophospholipase L1-like esterase
MKPPSTTAHRRAALRLSLLAAAALAGCGGDGGSAVTSEPQVPITVSAPADLGTIESDATTQLAATVVNDPANRGVTWTVSCPTAPCGMVSPTTTASDAITTYTAPTTRPPVDLAVSITATSVSSSAVTATTKVTVAGGMPPAVPTVSFVATPSSITVGGSATLTWSSTNATSCAASGAWSGTQASSGTTSVAPTTAGVYTYTLICTGAGGSGSASTSVSLSGIGSSPGTSSAMALISRGVPIVASSALYHATSANDGDYNTEWRSNGAPATLALDLSSVPVAQRQNIWLVWYNDGTYAYNHVLINQPGYNNAGSYTIEANAAPGGGAAPSTGWVPLASLSGNVLHSYSHYLNFAGYNWIRGNFTASDGSVLNADIAINLDVYSANNGVTDGWFFNGDSITANCMRHNRVLAEDENNPGRQITLSTPSFGVQVNAIVGTNTPAQENGGSPGFTSGNMTAYLAGWLQHIPSKYVTINLGTNDAANSGNATTFYANMQQLVQTVIAAGKIPVVPTIPYSTDPKKMANIPALNDQIRALYLAYPIIVPGPDLWTYFMNNPQYISTDHLHPNAQGCVAYRTLWSQFAASTMYGH